MVTNSARVRKLALARMLSLVAVGVIASVLTSAQSATPDAWPPPGLITEGMTIFSGNDIGFRVDRIREGVQIGTLVVRVGGRWVDTSKELPESSPLPFPVELANVQRPCRWGSKRRSGLKCASRSCLSS